MSGISSSKRNAKTGTSRRDFLRHGSIAGLAAAASGHLTLAADATATPGESNLEEFAETFKDFLAVTPPANWKPTEDSNERPFYRDGAPFRAKISPPGAPGDILLIRGRVWGLDTRKPLPHCVLEVWQADTNGRYDNTNLRKPIHPAVFLNRARMITDETGYYEFETVHPGPRDSGPSSQRAPRIHYIVRHPAYRILTTQLLFRGDTDPQTDRTIQPSMIIDLEKHQAGNAAFRTGRFDIVLERA